MATATERRSVQGLVVGNGIAYNVKPLCSTVELAASASGTTIDFGDIPTSARILGHSKVYADDLATSGSPTLDLGFAAVDSNITTDPDALNDGLAVSSAITGSAVIKDHANYGKTVWELLGLTADPGGSVTVQGTIKDAATNAAGTVTLDLLYCID